MKKRVLMLLGAAVMALSLGACKDKKKSEEPEQQQTVQQTFTVAFEVDGTRVATAPMVVQQCFDDHAQSKDYRKAHDGNQRQSREEDDGGGMPELG